MGVPGKTPTTGRVGENVQSMPGWVVAGTAGEGWGSKNGQLWGWVGMPAREQRNVTYAHKHKAE